VSVTSEQMKKGETAAQKREDVINQVLGTTNK